MSIYMPILNFDKKKYKYFYIDLETSGLRGPLFDHTIGYAYGWGLVNEHNYYASIAHKSAELHNKPMEEADILEFKEALREIMLDDDVIKVGHNLQFDVKHLAYDLGLDILDIGPTEDTYVMIHACDSSSKTKGLKSLAQILCNMGKDEKDALDAARTTIARETKRPKDDVRFDEVPLSLLRKYAKMDIAMTKGVFFELLPRIKPSAYNVERVYRRDLRATKSLARLEMTGLQLVPKWEETVLPRVERELEDLGESINKLCSSPEIKGVPLGFNFNSGPQLGELLIANGIDLPRTPTGKNFSTNKDTFTAISRNPATPTIIQKILSQRKLYSEKLKEWKTYYRNLDKYSINNRAYAGYTCCKTVTGRLSGYNPNMQNITQGSAIRELFIAADGYTQFMWDFSQMEVCLFAHYAESRRLIDAINGGQDMHTYMAENVLFANGAFGDKRDPSIFLEKDIIKNGTILPDFMPKDGSPVDVVQLYKKHGISCFNLDKTFTKIIRGKAKTIFFGILYGMGISKLATNLLVPEEQARKIMQIVHGEIPEVRILQNKLREAASTSKDIVVTNFHTGEKIRKRSGTFFYRNDLGRIFHISEDTAYKSANYLVQGTGADVAKEALNMIDDLLLGHKSRLINQIHDEFVVEIHDDEWFLVPKISKIMNSFTNFAVPLKSDVDMSMTTWINKVTLTHENPDILKSTLESFIDIGNKDGCLTMLDLVGIKYLKN